MIPALGRQRQKDFSEFDASLVYKSSSRRVMTTQALPRNQTGKKKKKNLSVCVGGRVFNPRI